MANSWDFSGSAEWYDVILGKEEYEKNAKFVFQQLQKFNVKKVLELACGSGLYLFPLKKNGFDIGGLDISKEMLDVSRKRSSKPTHTTTMLFQVGQHPADSLFFKC